MHKYLLLLSLLVPLSASAVIYKSVDSEGNVIFADQPSPNAEEIPTPSPNTVQLPKPAPEAETRAEPETKNTKYTSLKILSPTTDEAVRSNPGLLLINLELTPELNVKAGDSVSILVDGYVLIRNSRQLSAQIPDISRGTHRVQAVVTNKKGQSLIKSPVIPFFMHRQSLLNKPGASRVTPLNAAGKPINPGPQGTYYLPGPTPPLPATK